MIRTAILLLTASCATVQPKPDLESTYRKDMEFTVDGRRYTGVAVLPPQDSYEIEINRSGGDYFSLSSCHRHIPIKDPGRKIEYKYKPNKSIEDNGSCLVQMSMLDENGKHRWGVIDLVNDATLAANIQCNGKYYATDGASFCQSRAGLVQKIWFSQDVKPLSDEMCPIDKIGPREYAIELQLGYCIYAFTADGKYHRMTTYGYDDQIGG